MKISQIVGIVALVHLVAIVPVFLIQGCKSTDVTRGKPCEVIMPPSEARPLVPPTTGSVKSTEVWPEASSYTVQSGDSLSGIARKYGVSLTELMAANGLTNPNMVRSGQKLTVPKKNVASSSASVTRVRDDRKAEKVGERYTVKPGDSLSKIAAAYGTTSDEIRKLNNITGDKILVNQKLVLPGGVAARAVSTPAVAPEISIKPEPDDVVSPMVSAPAASPAVAPAAPAPVVSAPAPTAPAFVRTHVVQAGQDLKKIAMLYLISADRIKEFNGLTDVKLNEGQILKIPMVE